jgi:hypothetical protein
MFPLRLTGVPGTTGLRHIKRPFYPPTLPIWGARGILIKNLFGQTPSEKSGDFGGVKFKLISY